MNNKGFAIGGIIYSILLMFILFIFSIISLLGNRKFAIDKIKNETFISLNKDILNKKTNLIDKLLQNKSNLIKENNIYYFNGKNPNNFLWYAGHEWRIISFDENERTLKLISQQPLTAISLSKSIWNNEQEFNSSYINSWLNGYFYESLGEYQNNIIPDDYNVIMPKFENPAISGTNKIVNSNVGLLDISQYEKAGGVNSFFNISDWWWLSNRYSETQASNVDSNGKYNYDKTENVNGVRPVIKIKDIYVNEGIGTQTNQYRESIIKNKSDQINIGDYIILPSNQCGSDNKCIFRIVNKDNNSLKIVLNGLANKKSKYGNVKINKNSPVFNVLNGFAVPLKKYLYTGTDKKFNIGMYSTGVSYLEVNNENLTSNIGLPTVGELFSGNDIDIKSSNIFVNKNIIENVGISNSYWLMNRYSGNMVRKVDGAGFLSNYFVFAQDGIRPVLFINNNSKILSGDGSPNNPYIFE